MSPKSGRGSLNLIKTGGGGYLESFGFIFVRRLPAVNIINRTYNFTTGAYITGFYITGAVYATGAVYFNTVTAFNSFLFSFITYKNR